MTQKIKEQFNRKKKASGIFFDIASAFDKVWHMGLLYKLDKLKILPYLGKWIASYLEDRYLTVRCNNQLSAPKPISTGVPQGSVLGPALFNIFFNDITETQLHRLVNLALFADDLAAWTRAFSLQHIETRLQNQLNELLHWERQWRTKLSATKTVWTLFSKNQTKHKDQIKLTYNKTKLKYEKNPKFLGLTLDPKMLLTTHSNSVHSRVLRRVNMLKRIRGMSWGASTKLILSTYQTLARTIIDYGPFATICTTEECRKKLETLQRAAIRVATYWPPHTPASQIYSKINLEPEIDRAYKHAINFLKKSIKTNGLAKQAIIDYQKTHKRDEGASWKNKRPTLLARLKDKHLNRHTITNTQTTPPEATPPPASPSTPTLTSTTTLTTTSTTT